MKSLILCTFILIFVSQGFTQDASSEKIRAWNGKMITRSYAERKARNYHAIKTSGLVFLGVSGTAAVTSMVLLSSSDWSNQDNYSYYRRSDKDDFAEVMLAVSLPVAISGSVLTLIGIRKSIQYDSLLDRSRVQFDVGKEKMGISFVTNF